MILFARTIAVVIGMLLSAAATYFVWFAWNFALSGKILAFLLAIYLSVVVGALCGEHFLKVLKRNARGHE